ncbi:MAG: hypothetical protein JWM92_446 [Candidatus Nomurabacteria bacterium]|nr:hypothetical protein [Candidatus Nomurabacteria bacterium]
MSIFFVGANAPRMKDFWWVRRMDKGNTTPIKTGVYGEDRLCGITFHEYIPYLSQLIADREEYAPKDQVVSSTAQLRLQSCHHPHQ